MKLFKLKREQTTKVDQKCFALALYLCDSLASFFLMRGNEGREEEEEEEEEGEEEGRGKMGMVIFMGALW